MTVQSPNFLASGGLPPSTAVVVTRIRRSARRSPRFCRTNRSGPYSINYTLSVQRSFGNDYTVEARYLGTKGVHFSFRIRSTVFRLVTRLPLCRHSSQSERCDARGLTDLLSATSSARKMQRQEVSGPTATPGLALRTRLRHTCRKVIPNTTAWLTGCQSAIANNFSYNAAFTWSHALDDSTATVFSTCAYSETRLRTSAFSATTGRPRRWIAACGSHCSQLTTSRCLRITAGL